MVDYYFLYICQTKTEAFHVMAVTGMYTVEAIEYLLEVITLDTNSVISDGDHEFAGLIPGADLEMQRNIGPLILDGVVHEVEDDVGEVHLIDHAKRILSLELGIDGAADILDFEFEGVDYAVDEFIDIHLLKFHGVALALKHGHLEHLLYLEAQTFGLIVDDA